MRLYVHMMLCGSVCTLLYLFCNRILPYELPLRWRRGWIRINIIFYLLPVPWFAAETKELVRWTLEKAGMTFGQNEFVDVYDATSVWKSFLVLNEEGRVIYITGYREILPVILIVLAVWIALPVGWVALYMRTSSQYRRSMVLFDADQYLKRDSQQRDAGHCLENCRTKRKIVIGVSPCVASPVAVGLFKPVILLPVDYREYENAMEEVILHEWNHVSCRDIVERFFAFVLVVVHFFNPLTYFLFRESIAVSEMLSDEAAVSGRTKQQKANYIRCILEASQKAGSSKTITTSLGISKSLMRKRMEQIMGRNKKKIWKKSVVAAVVSVCALASSIPALAYRKPHEYVQSGADDWNDRDFLVFAQDGEENPMEGVHIDFSQGDTVFVGGDSYDYEVINSGIQQGQQEQKQSVCAHSYVTGTIAEHERNADGSCTVVTYEAQQCAKCGNTVRGDEVSSFTYKSCPHMEAGGAKPDEKELSASETGVVNTDALRVRTAAERDAEVMTLLKEGAIVKVIAEENEYYKVLVKSEESAEILEGYVRKEYLNLSTDDTVNPIF
ncbi:MAG: SH3 domain-containing protein [Lachnospiraceae bacterium]|nr:SH3 domain-containing protein [Lachnospiraceae bacterium]